VVKIFINARFLSQPITGVQRYAIELVKSIDRMLENGDLDRKAISFTLLTPHGSFNELGLKNIQYKKIGFLSGHMWEQIELPVYTFGNLLLNFCNTGPILKRQQVVTICDASVFAYPNGYSKSFRLWYQFLLPILGKVAGKIITISSFSKAELIRYCKIAPEKIIPILLGVESLSDSVTDTSFLATHGLNNAPYVLAVSSMNPNKNFTGLASAITLLGDVKFKVVIAGGANSKVFGGRSASLPNFVTQVGYVSDDELKLLYKYAACFVYPSFYEGFGLPPLEAMAAGCPVIVSNAASLPEVCGDAALYCEPNNPSDIAEKIQRLMSDKSLRNELREKGFEHVKQFTWDKCAKETWAVIEKVLSK
jgi:glycosyltransferase involved in cell wall biosynthesis